MPHLHRTALRVVLPAAAALAAAPGVAAAQAAPNAATRTDAPTPLSGGATVTTPAATIPSLPASGRIVRVLDRT